MTRKSIEEQVYILRKATEKAGRSPEAASDFLRSAGIFVTKTNAVKARRVYAKDSGIIKQASTHKSGGARYKK